MPKAEPVPAARPAGSVGFYNFLAPGNGFREEVLAGLSAAPKYLPPRWAFNETGMRIQRVLAETAGWYQSRDEASLVRSQAEELAALAGPGIQLIEIGPGASPATLGLTARLEPALHLQVDADPVALTGAARALAAACPWLNICGILANPAAALVLPEFAGLGVRRKLVFLPATALTRFSADHLLEVLRGARGMAGRKGAVLACVDFKKERRQLDAAYNDIEGIMELLNVNLLNRVNEELGADFQVQRFAYRAAYDEVQGRMEMRLHSTAAQFVNIGGRRFDLGAGEPLLTGVAALYTAAEFAALARDAGLNIDKLWVDERQRLGLHWMTFN
ncbi:MAG TPA: L-histidine N(alpha)-methyltransferase [Burkholderiales bacterium]|nr:L-histidine N(alpha)-methyltransferase [Burkholderiales bacterium]